MPTLVKNQLLDGANAEIAALQQSLNDLKNAQNTPNKRRMSIVNHVYNKLLKSVTDPEFVDLLKTDSQNSKSILSQLSDILVDQEGKLLQKATFCCSGFCLKDKEDVIKRIADLKGAIFEGYQYAIRIDKNAIGYCFQLFHSLGQRPPL
ncbi:MAG TPA: hypothetical protein PLQ20_00345 [Candidatus Paceibacterota bacterium]|jgi:hypothetical protein|nr:hypothetical protein [Candidatus Paceibacterota bacterium]